MFQVIHVAQHRVSLDFNSVRSICVNEKDMMGKILMGSINQIILELKMFIKSRLADIKYKH